ncbi:MAG: hypothetical protein WCK93_07525 [Nitrosomonadales bacterium]
MAKQTYRVRSPLDLDNNRYEIGELVDIDDKQVESLLLVAVVEGPVDTPKAVAPVATGPADSKVRMASLSAAISSLDPNNQDLWLKDGKPSTEAVAAAVGFAVSSTERDAAWVLVNAA